MQSPLCVQIIPGMGRGVVAAHPFHVGEVIEICPVIVLEPGEGVTGALAEYVFWWGDDGRTAIALGHGSLYNHSAAPNAAFAADLDRREIVFRAVRDIAAGEQVLIDYEWDDYASFGPVPVLAQGFSARLETG